MVPGLGSKSSRISARASSTPHMVRTRLVALPLWTAGSVTIDVRLLRDTWLAPIDWPPAPASRLHALDPDQGMHPVAQRAAQAIDRRRALHCPALDDQRRNRVELIWANEFCDTFDRCLLAGHGQA